MKRERSGIKIERKEINTSAIVQKTKAFREVTLNLGKCREAMISILQACAQNASFTEKERQELFFSLTQLFHNRDKYIHRLLLLLLTEIPVNTRDSIIITHSLSKDISGDSTVYQGHAIRCLCGILDAGNVLSLERFLKLSIVSNVHYTASAALCGALRLIEGGKKEAVLRWIPEIRQASKSSQHSVRFHALLLLYALKSDDTYAAAQLASSIEDPRSQLEQCVSLAIASQSIKIKSTPAATQFLNHCLKLGSPIVQLEAVRRAPEGYEEQSVEVISRFLSSSTLKCFAALRTIDSSPNAQIYQPLLPKILNLMKHRNSSLAATASICVLKLGDENHVEVTTKRILRNCRLWAGPLLCSVAEECCKFAGRLHNEKLTEVVVFLLRIAKGQQDKFTILKYILTTEGIPREHLLPRLSEYLEDWDSLIIARTICDFISGEVSKLKDPSLLIPVLFNRINLDVTIVRMSAISTLAAIAGTSDQLKQQIVPLLELFTEDEADPVREEILLFINALKTGIDLSTIMTEFSIHDETEKEEAEKQEEAKENDEHFAEFIPVSLRPEFEKYGKVVYKTDSIDLTDADSEFVVSYFVNIFEKHIVLEFLCTNTIEGVDLANVTVELEDADVIETIAADSIKFQQTASMCCVLERTQPMIFGRYKATLHYTQVDDENEDEWSLDDVSLGCQTWMKPYKVPNFLESWEQYQENEAVSIFSISKVRSTNEGKARVEQTIGLYKDSEEKDKKKTTVQFSGQALDDSIVLIVCQLGFSKAKGVVCRIAIRSSNPQLGKEILQNFSFY